MKKNLRVRLMVALLRAVSRFPHRRHVVGLYLRVPAGVCSPAPLPGFSFATLFQKSLRRLPTGSHVLDIGTGCGLLALMAARTGGDVTATDLPHVPLSIVEINARCNGLHPPRTLHGDLFTPVLGERYQCVLFNPPFHRGQPHDDCERAYLGGPHGEVVTRFLADLPEHLLPSGFALIVLPTQERRQYAHDLQRYEIEVVARRFFPILGWVELLSLTPNREV